MNSTRNAGAFQHAIRLAANVSIEVQQYASQGNAILGIRDSGKSYSATFLAEQLIHADIPILAFDPIGVWHNLRCAGTGPGLPVVVAGGEHGDFPISPETVEEIVRVALREKCSLVIDLYDVELSKADWRRIVATAVRTMLYENKVHGLRHIFIEEAAEFCPQMVTRDYAGVYAEIEKLARMGGNAMLGYTLVNQRAEQVNKAVLELCDCLFLHRQKGRLSLTALDKWLSFGDKSKGNAVITSLPLLPQGECWVWQGGEDTAQRVKMPTKQTFHPNRREQQDAGARLEMPSIRQRFDVKPAKKEQEKAADPDPTPAPVIQYVFREGEIEDLKETAREAAFLAGRLQAMLAAVVAEPFQQSAEKDLRPLRKALSKIDKLPNPPAPLVNGATISQGQRAILITAATFHPRTLTLTQLGTFTGYTPSTMRTYLPELRAKGYMSSDGALWTIADAARELVRAETPEKPQSKKELLAFWEKRLSQGEGNILHCLYEAGHAGLPHIDALCEHTSYTPSTLRTYLPRLRALGLMHSSHFRIADEFLS